VFCPGRLPDLIPVARRFPDLKIIIDHAALPTSPPPLPMEALVAECLPLAEFGNIAVKASAFPCAVTEDFPFPTPQRCTRTLIDVFGPERVFWGTDLTRLPCSYRDGARYLSESDLFSPDELELLMGKGINDWLGGIWSL